MPRTIGHAAGQQYKQHVGPAEIITIGPGGAAGMTGAPDVALFNSTPGNQAPVLPLASVTPGRRTTFVNVGTGGNTVTLTRAGADLIFDGGAGATTLVLNDGQSATLMPLGGTRWQVVERSS